MSAKSKMREELASWKLIAEQSDRERIQYAGIVVAMLSKFGGEIVIPKENFDAVTKNHAVQSTILGDGAVKIRLLITTPQPEQSA